MPTINEAITSLPITESAVVTTANDAGLLYGVTLRSGTTASSILLRNGGSSGTVLWGLSLASTAAAGDTTTSVTFPYPIIFSTDIYATLTGTGALAYVAYKEIE